MKKKINNIYILELIVHTFHNSIDMTTSWTRLFSTGLKPFFNTISMKTMLTYWKYDLCCIQIIKTYRTIIILCFSLWRSWIYWVKQNRKIGFIIILDKEKNWLCIDTGLISTSIDIESSLNKTGFCVSSNFFSMASHISIILWISAGRSSKLELLHERNLFILHKIHLAGGQVEQRLCCWSQPEIAAFGCKFW